jgi:hypothetical protein
MASRIEKNLAGRVFNLQKQAGRVPPTLLASARRILQGTNSKGDVDSVRQYLGISRSGASALGRVGKQLARMQGAAFSITQDIELLQSAARAERPTAVATARLINNLNDQVQQAIKSKWAQRAAEGAARLLNRDPVMAGRFLKAVGRGLRMGGLIVTAAMGAAEVAERYFENRRMAGAAIGARKDLARELNTDPRFAQREQIAATEEVIRAKSKLRGLLDSFGFSGSTENEATKKFDSRKKQIEAMRRLAPHLGIHVDEVLAGAAARKGKLPSELTLRERNEALDAATIQKMPTLEQMAQSEQVQKRLEREYDHFSGSVGLFAKEIGSTFGLSQTPEQAIAERRDELAREYLTKELERLAQFQQDAEEAARQVREQRSPAKQQMHRDRLERADAEFNSHRSRHKAWSTS